MASPRKRDSLVNYPFGKEFSGLRARKGIIGVNWIRLSLMNSTLIAWQGLVITGVSFYLQSWCIEKKGPVFAAIFTPLALVFTMLCSTIFLGEMIYLGR